MIAGFRDGSQRVMSAHNIQHRRLRAGNESRPNLGGHAHVGHADNRLVPNIIIATRPSHHGNRAGDDRSSVTRGNCGSDPVYADDLPMKARHFIGDLPELSGIDR